MNSFDIASDYIFCLYLFGIGLFQFVLRRYILPVDEKTRDKLNEQTLSDGLMYDPFFGKCIMVGAIIIFVIFFLYHQFA